MLAALLVWAHAQGFAHRIAHGGAAPFNAAGLSSHHGEAGHRHSAEPRPAEPHWADSHAADPQSCAAFDAAAVAAATAVATLALIALAAPAAVAQTVPPALRSRHFCAYLSRAPPSAS